MASRNVQKKPFTFIWLTASPDYPLPYTAFRPPQLDLSRAQHIGTSSGSSALIESGASSSFDHVSQALRSDCIQMFEAGWEMINLWAEVGSLVESPAFEHTRSPWEFSRCATPADTPVSLQNSVVFTAMGGLFSPDEMGIASCASLPAPNPLRQRFLELTWSAPEIRHMTREELPCSPQKPWESCPQLPIAGSAFGYELRDPMPLHALSGYRTALAATLPKVATDATGFLPFS